MADHSELTPTSAPTWMDGARIGFSFLSLCHTWLTLFSPFLSPNLNFFCNFIFAAPHPVSFFLLLKLPQPLTYYALSRFNLLAYIFKLKLNSSPSTYSPINLKCAALISTCTPTPPSIYLPTCPSTFLPTNTLSRYLPNPTYMATPTYMVAIPIDPQQSTMIRKE
jgi:hypothetical protein